MCDEITEILDTAEQFRMSERKIKRSTFVVGPW